MFKFIKALFGKLGSSFKVALPFLVFLIIVLVNIAIWWMGPWLEINNEFPFVSVSNRLVCMGLFSLSCCALWGVYQWRKFSKFKAEVEHQEVLKEDPVQAAVENQEDDLNKVIFSLKDSLNKRNYLYSLPWYLVMGLENAGKTSLINRSGQNYTFSTVLKSSGIKSKNTYSFDWWVGDKSVLIDPDGEILTQGLNLTGSDSDGEVEKGLWLHFLTWLEKTRSQRPLNGIVLAIDISKLATSTVYERKAYATILRSRIRELMETLSTRLPVYVALTKLDLLYGFEAFFSNYKKDQRDDVLGFTFSLDSVESHDSWLSEFDKEYNAFIDYVNAIFPQLASESIEDEDRNAIYSFTRQISGLKEVLSNFFEDALSSDRFSTSPLVRGVYFASVYQQGVPTNAFDDAASRRYGLTHAINKAQNAKNSTTYFTKSLFNKIIYPEAGLASDNFRVAKQKRRIMLTSILVCSMVTVLLAASWHRFYEKNIHQSDAVISKVNNYLKDFPVGASLTSQEEILPPLNTIRDATLEFGFFRDKPRYISDLGLYQGHLIGPQVEITYLNLLEFKYLPSLMADLVVDLKKAKSDEDKLAVLRVYRMLVDKSGRYDDFVLNYFSRKWQVRFSGMKEVQDKLLQHLEYALQHTDLETLRGRGDNNAIAVLKPYEKLIASTQAELGALSIDERVYRNLKLTAQTKLGTDQDMSNLIGPVFPLVFDQRGNSSKLRIPAMLSKKGFENYFLPSSESVSDLALIDSWVLGQTETARFSEADKQALKEKIRASYVADYTNSWRSAVNGFEIKDFKDINEAVNVLENLTGNSQPIIRFLSALDDNTNIFPELPEDRVALEELQKSTKYNIALKINAPFSDLNGMIKASDDKPANIDEVVVAIDQLKAYLKAIQDAPDVGRAALETTKARTSLNSVDPIYTLNRISAGLPKPLDSMLTKLANQSWYVIKQEAIRYLEVRWHNDIYKVYEQKFASKYPFRADANSDVSLQDFEKFFAPNGTLDQFYSNQLKMFIEENLELSGELQGKSLIRDDVLAQLDQAKLIQDAFFNRKGVLDVSFGIEPVNLTANKRRGLLNVDGQNLSYSHGPRNNVEMVWPNTLGDTALSKMTLVPTQLNFSPRSIDSSGPWAFFRLLGMANVVSSSVSNVTYQFSIDEGLMEIRVNTEKEVNPFTRDLFKSFSLSDTLY
ncbi:type VI secretion system membrane subunit TssM [Marinomonas posidonica]|uniref:Type VI secretion protein IcmF n=1 Tax=Marinomonas posidonica (strain CECT 7376 / NCIMB 14433 / IVIA-Po-181) TaxID=491952 RepID=F6CWV1_MARPP|nr:type VI secretion system membrane subunit TssM [Marinomonas posidonica]AEF55513.1 type VI secretion protein IcmF [Marinomonas posidonica IVIA-Po-181]